jgi:hypothetical protein
MIFEDSQMLVILTYLRWQIGWDRSTQGATSFYTVITDKAGNLISSFPGLTSGITNTIKK